MDLIWVNNQTIFEKSIQNAQNIYREGYHNLFINEYVAQSWLEM